MRVSIQKMISSCLLLTALLIVADIAGAAERKLLVVGEEFAPFEFVRDGQVVGIDIDIATTILKKMNIEAEFKILPWKRAWYMIEHGEADAVLTTSRKTTREPYLWYPEEDMWVSEFVFFARKDKMTPEFKGYDTAIQQKLDVGIINGNSYHSSFWAAFPYKNGTTSFQGDLSHEEYNDQLDVGTSLQQNFKKLLGGRFDIMLADKTYGAYTAKLMGLQDKIGYYETPLYSKPYPMPFAKQSTYPGIKGIAERFEQELKAMKDNGQIQTIYDKWLQ